MSRSSHKYNRCRHCRVIFQDSFEMVTLGNDNLKNWVDIFRGQKLNTNFVFLKLFGHRRDIPAKFRDIPPKKLDFPGLKEHAELVGPHPFTWKTPTPPENIRT